MCYVWSETQRHRFTVGTSEYYSFDSVHTHKHFFYIIFNKIILFHNGKFICICCFWFCLYFKKSTDLHLHIEITSLWALIIQNVFVPNTCLRTHIHTSTVAHGSSFFSLLYIYSAYFFPFVCKHFTKCMSFYNSQQWGNPGKIHTRSVFPGIITI